MHVKCADPWSPCQSSLGCGAGLSRRTVRCVSSAGITVDEALCASAAARPATTRSCDAGDCVTYNWLSGPWGKCSVACGGGLVARNVTCVDSNLTTLADVACDAASKPEVTRLCNSNACVTFGWSAGDWSPCSRDCGGGVRSRTVSCVSQADGGVAPSSECSSAPAPYSTESCNHQSCPDSLCSSLTCSGHGSCDDRCELLFAMVLMDVFIKSLNLLMVSRFRCL
jgi:hypothetical protein